MGGVEVTGGTHSVQVDEQRLTSLAAAFGHAGRDTLSTTLHLHGYLLDPDLLSGALFDPAGFAAFEVALEAALDGMHGLTWAGARCELLDLELRAAALLYAGADQLHGVVDALRGLTEIKGAAELFLAGVLTGDSASHAAQVALTATPELADTVMTTLARDLREAADALPDGHGIAVRTGLWGVDSTGAAGRPPRQLSDLMGELGRRNDDPHHGSVDIRFLYRADGSRAVVVDITGTKSWSTDRTPDITSLVTNGRALFGERTSYEQGVLEAMHDAGVTSTDDVMIVGHSEGGMVAVTTARDAVRSGQFTVTHVVTAGSPVGISSAALPAGVKLLALENTRDIVPHLDGKANPDRRNLVTARGAYGNGTVVGDHDIGRSYVPLARDVQTSTDSALTDYLHGCDGYFDAESVTTKTYQIVRHY